MSDQQLSPLNFDQDYFALGISSLTSQEEAYVQHRSRNVNPTAAARASGYRKPVIAVANLAERTDIQQAISYFREMARQTALDAGAIIFTKDDATALLLEAHAKSITATEEVNAIDKLIRLHGLNTPEVVDVNITRVDQLSDLSDEHLLKMSNRDIQLSPASYVSKVDGED